MKTFSESFSIHLMFFIWLMLAAESEISVALGAGNLQGATEILEKIREQGARETGKTDKADQHSKLRTDLDAFRTKLPTMTSADAAKGWLELVDRRAGISRLNYNSPVPSVNAEELLDVLPPPEAWDELSKAIAQRPPAKGSKEIREIGLRLLAATLTRNDDAWKKEIAALQLKGKNADPENIYQFKSLFEQLSEEMFFRIEDTNAVPSFLERRLDGLTDPDNQPFQIPNLVALVGKEKTEVFLRRVFQHPKAILEIDGVNDTSRLARKIALEMIDQLKNPQWSLVNSLDSIELFEALEKKFLKATPATAVPQLPDFEIPADTFGDYAYQNAQVYYLLGLISHDRQKEAVSIAKKLGQQEIHLSTEGLKAMERAGYTKALDTFFFELLSLDPSLEFWNEYVELAAKAGETERMVKLARSAAVHESLSKKNKQAIREILFKALLAADQIDEGVNELQKLMAFEEKEDQRSDEISLAMLGVRLARIGILLKKPDWIEEGLRAAKNSLKKDDSPEGSTANALANILQELKRGQEAETVLSDALGKMAQNNRRSEIPGISRLRSSAQLLVPLAALYHQEDRHNDVLILLDQSPDWGAKDLADLFQTCSIMGRTLPIRYVAAIALAKVGRKEEAKKIANALVDHEPELDAGYELLLAFNGEKAMARLDELFARDPFEERPLIWKAQLLQGQDKLEEAEEIVRRAISIDPSDGEQGPGDRMRAYSVLADIREARGDKKEADFLRNAVKAIRLSEEADEYYAAGLLKRAVKMYEQSLTLFADAYCVQSRLAIQLAALGLHEQAEAHYRRAYELMPESFGRVESHCFGCERIFEGQGAQGLADKIFSELVRKTPGKPQLHYLLGYLREEQERYSEAMSHFQTAVKLDPDYLNAWIKIQAMAEQVHLPTNERDQVVFNLLRLDPLRRHKGDAVLNHVADLAGLWKAVESSLIRQPDKQAALYPLAASKIEVEKQKNDPAQKRAIIYSHSGPSINRKGLSPGTAVGKTIFVNVAAQLFVGDGMSFAE